MQHKVKDCWEKMEKVQSLNRISPEDVFTSLGSLIELKNSTYYKKG